MDASDRGVRDQEERRAPGWELRCLRCGYRQPYGRRGIRIGAASVGKSVLLRCSRCGRLGCHRVTKPSRSAD